MPASTAPPAAKAPPVKRLASGDQGSSPKHSRDVDFEPLLSEGPHGSLHLLLDVLRLLLRRHAVLQGPDHPPVHRAHPATLVRFGPRNRERLARPERPASSTSAVSPRHSPGPAAAHCSLHALTTRPHSPRRLRGARALPSPERSGGRRGAGALRVSSPPLGARTRQVHGLRHPAMAHP